ncbi:hypothetical protein JHD46_08585, partial [Sulfurimonas sp. SAG-AH-194-C20]
MQGNAGILILNSLIPLEFSFKEGEDINSKLFYERMSGFAKKNPSMYAKNISKIERLGEKMAYSLGASVGIEDLIVDKKKVNKFISSLSLKMDKAKTEDDKIDILLGGLKDGTSLSAEISSSSNQIMEQVASGSRGKPVQFARLSVGPIYSIDMNQKPKTTLIRNSFNDGLTSNEYFNVSSQGRFSSVAAANATSEPGALGKDLIASGDTEKIADDCRTQNGEYMSTSSKKSIGHYRAGYGGVLITAKYLSSIKERSIQVRTPVTCEAKTGVCYKCYGLTSSGAVAKIGDEVGIIAGQTLSQLGVQLTLSTKHSVSGKKDSSSLSGTKGLNILINSPDSYGSFNRVATTSGNVSKVEKLADGSSVIHIGKEKIKVGKGITTSVKVGDYVSKGDRVTKGGEMNLKDIVKGRGNLEARRSLSDAMHGIFKKDMGIDISRKHMDTLARGQLSLYQDQIGNIIGRNKVDEVYNGASHKYKVDSTLIGKYISEDIALFEKGTKVTT